MSHSPSGRSLRTWMSRSAVGLVSCLTIASVATGLVGAPQSAAAPEVQRLEVPLTDRAESGWSWTGGLEIAPEMVGLTWDAPSTVEFRVRGQYPNGSWSEWIHLESAEGGPDVSAIAAPRMGTAGPAWLGHDMVALNVEVEAGVVDHLVLHELDSERPTSSGIGPSSASALPGQPAIITRAQWGADESWRSANADCETPRVAGNATYVVMHHTAGNNNYSSADSAALLRGIYNFHVYGNGWCDIAYNFLVDKYGQVFEGRFGGMYDAVIGGHTGGWNTGSVGVAVLGDLTEVQLSQPAYNSIVSLLAFKMGHHGIDPRGTTDVAAVDFPSSRYRAGEVVRVQALTSHGDLSNTGCPGLLRDRISALRSDVAARIAANDRDIRLMADWDGNGSSTPGVYQNGRFYLRNSNTNGPIQTSVHYGASDYVPVAGDWDGNGTDTVGVYVNGMWYLRNSNTPGPPDIVVNYGIAGYRPVVGDWDGDGRDGIGVFVSGNWYLRQTPTPGRAEIAFAYGAPGYQPLAGNWDGSGGDGIGVFTGGHHYLRNVPSPGAPQLSAWYGGLTPDRAVAGDWNGDGRDTIGINRGAYWYLRNANQSGPTDILFWF